MKLGTHDAYRQHSLANAGTEGFYDRPHARIRKMCLYMIEEEGVSLRCLELRGEIPITAKGLPDLSNAMVSKRHFCGPKTLSELHWMRRYALHVAMFVFELQKLDETATAHQSKGHRDIHCPGNIRVTLRVSS